MMPQRHIKPRHLPNACHQPKEKTSPGLQKLQEETMALADETLNEALITVPADRVDVCKEVLQIVYDNLK